MRVGDVLDVDSLRRREGRSSVDISIGVCYEIFEFFLALETVDLSIEEGKVIIIFDADLDVLSSDLVANGAEIEVFGDVVKDAVGTQTYVSDI